MPTENIEKDNEKVIMIDDKGKETELKKISDDALDSLIYCIETMTEGNLSFNLQMPRNEVRSLLKLYGLETITRKRLKKLLMGAGVQRNLAEAIVKQMQKEKIKYTPQAGQNIIDFMNKEIEKLREG